MSDLAQHQSALTRYRQSFDSGNFGDLPYYRELAVRERGELFQRLLDDHHVAMTDPLRFEAARLVNARRDLLLRLGPDVFDDRRR